MAQDPASILPRWRVVPRRLFDAVTMSFLIAYALFVLGLIWSVVSFSDLRSLIAALSSKEVLFAIRLSLITATSAMVLSVAIGVPAAYALSRKQFPGKAVVDTLLDLPVVLPPIAAGMALLALFKTSVGDVTDWLGLKFVFEPAGIVVAQFTVVCALGIRVLKSGFDSLDPKYERVARTLGFSQWQTFRRIVLPMSAKAILAAAVITWARAMGEFGATVVLCGATSFKTEVLSIAIFLNLAVADIKAALAITLILMFISLVTLLFFKRFGERAHLVD
jgi:molybdate transport system permease protein